MFLTIISLWKKTTTNEIPFQLILNASANFVYYCFSGREFRNRFCQIIKCRYLPGRHHPRGSNNNASYVSGAAAASTAAGNGSAALNSFGGTCYGGYTMTNGTTVLMGGSGSYGDSTPRRNGSTRRTARDTFVVAKVYDIVQNFFLVQL